MGDNDEGSVSVPELVEKLRDATDLLSVLAVKDVNLDLEMSEHVFTVNNLDVVVDGVFNISVRKHQDTENEEEGSA